MKFNECDLLVRGLSIFYPTLFYTHCGKRKEISLRLVVTATVINSNDFFFSKGETTSQPFARLHSLHTLQSMPSFGSLSSRSFSVIMIDL